MPPRAASKTTRRTTRPASGRRIEPAETTITIEDLGTFDESKNILVFGESGAGKTSLIGGAPDSIFLSTENGTIAAKRQGSKSKLIRVKTWKELEAALDLIDKILEETPERFRFLLVDSVPQMQRMLLKHLLQTGMEESRKNADLDVPQIQDHQKWQNMFMRFIDRIVEMPIDVLFTATSMRVETEDDEGEPHDIVLPAIQGKAKEGYAVAQYLCASMSSVWHLGIERRKGGKHRRVLRTVKDGVYFAKDRYDALPAKVVIADYDPTTMARIIERIESGKVMTKSERDEESSDDPDVADIDDEEMDDEEDEETPAPPKRRAKRPAPEPEEEDEEEEPEEAPKPARRRAPAPAAKKPAARSRKAPEPEEDDYEDDEEDDEEDDTPPKKPATRRRTPAARKASAKKPAPKSDDLDFDDDEDDENDDY